MHVRVEALSAGAVEVTTCWDVCIANIVMEPAGSASTVTLGTLEKAIFIPAHFDAIRLHISFLVTIPVRVRMKGKTSYSQTVSVLSHYLIIYLSVCLSVYLSIYSCCSHLERRESVKRLFHFSFLIIDSR
jgi:hypothetical protein